MRGVPKSGQWFRIRFPSGKRWQTVFRAVRKYTHGDLVRLVAVEYAPGYASNVDLAVIRYNQFEIITDPEEEALLALAYM